MIQTLINFFISPAYADVGAAANPQGGGLSMVMMFAMLFVAFYFMIWRPQNKRAREQRSLMDSLAKGDEILTAGGLLGKVIKLNEQFITVAIADNVEIILQKSSVVSVMPKGTIKSIT